MRHVFGNVLQPLIDFFEAILQFFHDSVGLGWGMSIVALTVLVRACLLPLTMKQFKSMQNLARHQPELKKLQEKYKNDKERLNQEMMKFYRENKVNPFASCLPLLAQLPVFLSLFYMLQADLRRDICPDVNPPSVANPQPCGPGGEAQFLFIPDLTTGPRGWVLIVLIVALHRIPAAVDDPHVDHDGPHAAPDHDRAAVLLRPVRVAVPGRTARVLDHHEPVDDRPAGDRPETARPVATRAADGVRRRLGSR